MLPWLPWRRRDVPGRDPILGRFVQDAPAPEPAWRGSLWLTLWIVLPCYGLYCFSMRDFVSPLNWIVATGDFFAQHWILLGLETLVLAAVFAAWPMVPRLVAAAALIAAAAAFNMLFLQAAWKFTWHPGHAYDALSDFGDLAWKAGSDWIDLASDRRVGAAILAALPALLWYFSGRSIAQRLRQTLQYLAVAAVCLLLCAAIFGVARVCWNQEVVKALLHHENFYSWEARYAAALSDHGIPSPAEAFRRAGADRPAADPLVRRQIANQYIQNAAAKWKDLVAKAMADHGIPTATQARQRVLEELAARPEAPVLEEKTRQVIQAAQKSWDAFVAAARGKTPAPTESQLQTDAAEHVAAERIAGEDWVWRHKWESLWMPRYLGVIWPAVAIAAACLLIRLPTRPLRYSAILLVLALNSAQTAGRLWGGSEPPMGVVATDLLAAQTQNPDGQPTASRTRTYIQRGLDYDMGGHPGSLYLLGSELRYYLAVIGRQPLTPYEFRELGNDPRQFKYVLDIDILRVDDPSSAIAADLKLHPQTTRVIFWERRPAPRPGSKSDVEIPLELGPQWKPVSDQSFYGRMHWVWQDLYVVHRREYAKQTAN